MAITEDTGVQPAPISTSAAWTGTALQTSSFSPNGSTLLIALLSGFGSSAGAVSGSITDSLSGSWSLLKRQNGFQSGVEQSTAEVWCRYLSSAPGSMTVKANPAANGGNGGLLAVRCLLGAASSQPGAVAGHSGTGSNAAQASVAAATGNMVYGAALNNDTSTLMTVLANTTNISSFSDSTNGTSHQVFKSSSTTAGTATYGYSAPNCAHDMCAVEILVAAVAATLPILVMPPRIAA